MRKAYGLLIAVAIFGATMIAFDSLRSPSARRAALMIVADEAVSAPELRLNGKVVSRPISVPGPWRVFAWADLDMPRGAIDAELSWIGADGQQRALRDHLFHQGDSLEPHCAYLLRLDRNGDVIPPAVGLSAERLTKFCHFGT